MSRRYRIPCGGEMHAVELDEDGNLTFHAHPEAFRDVDRQRAMAALSGEEPNEGAGCLRVAFLVRSGSLSTAIEGRDARRLLAALRGIRAARKLRRAQAER